MIREMPLKLPMVQASVRKPTVTGNEKRETRWDLGRTEEDKRSGDSGKKRKQIF